MISLERRDDLLDAIRSSTGLHPFNGEVLALVQRSFDAAESRAQAISKRNQDRSESLRAGIRSAAGALPVDAWGAAGIVQRRIELRSPEFYRLKAVPNIETIRAALREKK